MTRGHDARLRLVVGRTAYACCPSPHMASIRITNVPPGEAPLAIRQAWVGLELPLLRKGPGRYLAAGILSGPRSVGERLKYLLAFRYRIQSGYIVPTLPAIEVLERSNPSAARWWRENAPHAVRARRYMLFSTECCQPLE